MKYFFYITVLLAAVFHVTLSAEETKNSALACEIIENDNKKIQCTYLSDRVESDRNITFSWHSTTTPQDDRERTMLLKAYYGSIYDYRYFYGRAEGLWEISVKDDEDNLLASTTFVMDSTTMD